MKNKDLTMKKNSLVNGALVTTIGVIISKILGIIYVVPFHAIIGEKGGALYGYAYTVYLLFVSLSSAGIPLAISKIVSEYQTLGYHNAKQRAFLLGKRISLLLGFVCFLIIMLFAPFIAKLILGDIVGGNSIDDVTYVIRVIGCAILVVPLLSIYRGYFEGHRFMSPPSISQVVEQLVRVLIIVLGSFFAIRVFHFDLTKSVGVALFGAFIGALSAYLYLFGKLKKNKGKFNDNLRNKNEPIITNKTIIKKIIFYAFPFIMIDFFKSFYNYVDMFTVVKGLVNNANFSILDAENIYSMLSTWCQKFNMIVLSISTGLVVSLIPSLTESIIMKNNSDINSKINQSISMLLFLAVPMTIGISFLSKSIWILFYGDSSFGPSVLGYYIFSGFFIALFTAIVTILQTFQDYKSVFMVLISGLLFKLIFNNYMLVSFYRFGLPAYYGVISASIIGYLISFIIGICILIKKYKINFEKLVETFIDIMCASTLMLFVLFVLKFIIPVYSFSRINNIFIILFYALIGVITYFVYSFKSKLVYKIFGKRFVNKIFSKK